MYNCIPISVTKHVHRLYTERAKCYKISRLTQNLKNKKQFYPSTKDTKEDAKACQNELKYGIWNLHKFCFRVHTCISVNYLIT